MLTSHSLYTVNVFIHFNRSMYSGNKSVLILLNSLTLESKPLDCPPFVLGMKKKATICLSDVIDSVVFLAKQDYI